MGKFSMMGVLGLTDNMSPQLRNVLGLTTKLNRAFQQTDQTLRHLGAGKTVVRLTLSDGVTPGLGKLEQRLSRIGRTRINIGGAKLDRRVAAAVMGSPYQDSTVIDLERRRLEAQAKLAELRLAKAQAPRAPKPMHQAVEEAVQQAFQLPTYRKTRNPVVRWLQSQFAQAEVNQAQQALAKAAKSAPRFVEMARAGETPAHLHGEAMKKRWAQIMGMAQQEKLAVERLKAAQQGAIVTNPGFRESLRVLMGGQNPLKVLGSGITSLTGRVWNMAKSVGNLVMAPVRAVGRAFTSIPAMLGIGGIGYGLFSLVRGAIEFSSEMEQAQIAFTTMLGDAERAKRFTDSLFQFAAKTPFEFPDVTQNARMLLAMGFTDEQALQWLNPIGNAVAALGGSNQQEVFQRVILAIGQLAA